MLKLCKVCGEYKEESEFPVHSHGRLRSTCKMCWNQRNGGNYNDTRCPCKV